MNNGFGIMDGDKKRRAGGGTGGAASLAQTPGSSSTAAKVEAGGGEVAHAAPAGTSAKPNVASTGPASPATEGSTRGERAVSDGATGGETRAQDDTASAAASALPGTADGGEAHQAGRQLPQSARPLSQTPATSTQAAAQPALVGLGARPQPKTNSKLRDLSMRPVGASTLNSMSIRAGEPASAMLSENESGELEIRVAFESMPSNKHSYEYFCTADPLISEEYKQKLEAAIKSNDFKALDELDNELREAYKSQEQQTKFAGFKIVRKDGLGRKTNLPGAAKRIEIETRGLSSKNLIRLPLKNGEYLELGLDENGNFSGKAVPLTKEGSNLRRAVSPQEGDPNIVYNRYDTVLSDLQAMADVKMNGVDILPDIIKAIEQQKAQFMSNTVESESKPSNGAISQSSSSAISQPRSTDAAQQTGSPDTGTQTNTPQANAVAGDPSAITGLSAITGPNTPASAGKPGITASYVEKVEAERGITAVELAGV